MVHVLLVGTWPSRSCAIDSAVSNMAGSLCLCRDLAFVLAQNGAAQHPVESEVIWGLRWGLPQVEFLTPQALRSRRGVPLVRTGASAEWGTPPVSFGASPNAFSDWGLWFCHTHGNGKYADLLPVCRWRVFWAESPKPIVYRLFSILNSDLIHNNLCFYNVWIYSRLHSATRIIRAACYRKFYFDFPSPLLAYSPLAKPARVPLTQRIPLFHTRIHTFNIVSLLLA